MNKINIVIADSNYFIREGIHNSLKNSSNIFICERINTLNQIKEITEIDVVIVSFLLFQKEINNQSPYKIKSNKSKYLVLIEKYDGEICYDLLSTGCKGYFLVKDHMEVHELEKAITIVAEGGIWAERRLLEKFMTQPLWNNSSMEEVNTSLLDINLTVREEEIVKLVCQGISNNGIAETIYICEKTVKSHLSNIYRKYNIKGRCELCRLRATSCRNRV